MSEKSWCTKTTSEGEKVIQIDEINEITYSGKHLESFKEVINSLNVTTSIDNCVTKDRKMDPNTIIQEFKPNLVVEEYNQENISPRVEGPDPDPKTPKDHGPNETILLTEVSRESSLETPCTFLNESSNRSEDIPRTKDKEINTKLIDELEENNQLLRKVIYEQKALREAESLAYNEILTKVAENMISPLSTDPEIENSILSQKKESKNGKEIEDEMETIPQWLIAEALSQNKGYNTKTTIDQDSKVLIEDRDSILWMHRKLECNLKALNEVVSQVSNGFRSDKSTQSTDYKLSTGSADSFPVGVKKSNRSLQMKICRLKKKIRIIMLEEQLEKGEANSVEETIRRIVTLRKHLKSAKVPTSKIPSVLNTRYGINSPQTMNNQRPYGGYPQDPLLNPHLAPIEQIIEANEKITKMGLKLDPNNNLQKEYKIDEEVGKPLKQMSNYKIHDLNHKLKNSTQQIINQNKLIKELKTKLEEQNNTVENLKCRLSRSENVSHHKQLLLEQYKSKLTDIQSKASVLDKKLVREKSSMRGNLHEVKMMEDNIMAIKRREKDLQEQCAKLEDDKLNLEEELARKNLYIKKQLQLQLNQLVEDKRLELSKVVESYKAKVEDEEHKAQRVTERFKMYDQAIEEFLWMVEDLVYENNCQPDPVKKAHQMACAVLNLTPGELREMFRDCNTSYNNGPPRLFDQWLTEYRTLVSTDIENLPQNLAQFLFNICFTADSRGKLVSKRKDLHKL